MIRENILKIREQIKTAAITAGNRPEEVRLIAVTKTIDEKRILEALDAGITDVGENRVQELCIKAPLLSPRPTFHLIGHLQRNKVKDALQYADYIHSVDSLHLADEIQKQALKSGKQVNVLLQVNTSGEESKFGVSPAELDYLAEAVLKHPNLKLCGLMTIAPKAEYGVDIRSVFADTRILYERLKEKFFLDLSILSMGMSNDYLDAISEGATAVRIGRGIFGERV